MKREVAVIILVLGLCATAYAKGDATIITGGGRGPGLEVAAEAAKGPGSNSSTPVATTPTSNIGKDFTDYRFSPCYINGVYQLIDPVTRGREACPPAQADAAASLDAPPAPSPEEVARMLFDRAVALAPEPKLSMAPSRVGLTGLESYFWLDEAPAPIRATATAGSQTVTAIAYPVRYTWDFGDGNTYSTAGTGRPWTRRRPGNISNLYRVSDRYKVTVEVLWRASWSTGGPWQHLGYFTNSGSTRYPVRQIVPILVRSF